MKPEFRRGKIIIEFEDGDIDITGQMLELNIRRDSHVIEPSPFPLVQQGKVYFLDPSVVSSRRCDVVAVDELVTANLHEEDESEPSSSDPPLRPPTCWSLL